MLPFVSLCLQTISQEWTTILLCLTVFLILRMWWTRSKLPPGPTLIPFVGIVPGYVGSFDSMTVARYAKQYNSDIISIRYLGTLTVVLNSEELVKEMFVIRKDAADRCSNIWQLLNPNHRGLLANSGHEWAMANRTFRKLVRDFGYDSSNSRLETLMIEEVERMIQCFKEYKGEAFDPAVIINGAQCSIMMQLLFSRPTEYEDPEMIKCCEALLECEMAIWGPFGEYVLGTKLGQTVWKDYYAQLLQHYKNFVEMPNREVDKHVESFNGEVNDICDGYLSYMKTPPGLGETFDTDQLKNVMTDLVEASIESVKVEEGWFMIMMAANPEIQEKCYEEIKNVVGDRTPNYGDHKKTPYMVATMYELLRIHIELPFGVHQCCKDHDIQIRGYTIPKGTPIAANYTWLNFDPATWKNPDKFDPENFLQDGKLINTEKMASFSFGRRRCVGEPISKLQMYIYFAAWVKEFQIRMPEGVEPDFEPIEGSPYPKPFKIRLIPRQENEQ